MIGSETFIIVAFKCTLNRTPSSFARAICAAKNRSSAAALSTAASTTSPSRTGIGPLSAVIVPSAATNSTLSDPGAAMIVDCSVERKSSAPMVTTLVFDSALQAPIRCGCVWA